MASYHMSVKVGKVGSGGSHSDYIERSGKYATKDKSDLEYSASGNLPKWAENSADFWKQADNSERVNGSVYREFEIALPREFTKEQRLELVKEFIEKEIGNNKAYTFAIHNPKAMIEGGEQPHAHIMFSERVQDGIERDRDTYFKRYNAKNPERGGCKKDNPSMKPSERKEQLKELRSRFADLQNKHLERNGFDHRVTSLSLKDQGIDRAVEPHFGARVAEALKHEIKEYRELDIVIEIKPEQQNNVIEQAKAQALSFMDKFKQDQKLKQEQEQIKQQALQQAQAFKEKFNADRLKAQQEQVRQQAKKTVSRDRDDRGISPSRGGGMDFGR